MRIGIDVDEVLANWNGPAAKLLLKVSGRDLLGPDFVPRTWYWYKDAGYTSAEVSLMWDAIKKDRFFWYDLPHLEGTEKAIQYLNDRISVHHDDVYFITSRVGVRVKEQTEGWLLNCFRRYDRFRNVPNITVLISEAKGLCARALNLDAYVDDRWENCTSVTPPTKVFLFDCPANRDRPSTLIDSLGITRVTSLVGFVDALDPQPVVC